MHELSLDAKKTTHVAISEGCAALPMGLVNCSCALSFMVAGIRGVQTSNHQLLGLRDIIQHKRMLTWSRSNGVYTDTFAHVLIAEATGERDDGALGRRVIQ